MVLINHLRRLPNKHIYKKEAISEPIWRDRSFTGLFGDPFIRNTEMEGGKIAPSIEMMNLTLKRIIKNQTSNLIYLDQ